MNFILLTEAQKDAYRDEIIGMIAACDHEFVPPLSSRHGPTQTDFSGALQTENNLPAYFEDMRKNEILAAFEGDELLGFVAFKRDMTNQYLTAETLPNLYVAVLLVKPSARGQHLTSKMYQYLFNELHPNTNLYTRTWSTNAAHAAILRKFGLEIVIRLENDRGAGIDTVYFGRKRV